MLYVLLFLGIGIVIGWNWPQPPWARDAQSQAIGFFNSVKAKLNKPNS